MVLSILRRILKDKLATAAFAVVCIYFIIAVVSESYTFYCVKTDKLPIYERGNIDDRYRPPSPEFWLGTDFQGRSVLWRALHATRTAIKVGIMAGVLAVIIGVTLGILGGYFGGWIDNAVVWLYSTFAAVPTLLFVLAFALLVTRGFLYPPIARQVNSIAEFFHADPGMMAVYLGIGFTGWVGLCRVARAESIRLKNAAYIQSARALGFGDFRIIIRHLLPNLFHLVIIYFTIRFAYAIMTEVIVSYLGIGVQLEPSWGVMIAEGQQRLWRGVWWEVGAATGFMFFLVLAFHMLGDALRDILDPRLKI